jgi:hypothetical protein
VVDEDERAPSDQPGEERDAVLHVDHGVDPAEPTQDESG